MCVRRTSVLYNIEEFSGTTNQIAREKCVLKRTTSAVYYKLRRVYNNVNARVCFAPRTTTFALYNNIVTIWTIIIYYTTWEDFSNDFRVALVIIFLKIFASKNMEHYKYAYIKKIRSYMSFCDICKVSSRGGYYIHKLYKEHKSRPREHSFTYRRTDRHSARVSFLVPTRNIELSDKLYHF